MANAFLANLGHLIFKMFWGNLTINVSSYPIELQYAPYFFLLV
jgi:hypothetical protein